MLSEVSFWMYKSFIITLSWRPELKGYSNIWGGQLEWWWWQCKQLELIDCNKGLLIPKCKWFYVAVYNWRILSKCDNFHSQPNVINSILIEVSVNMKLKGFDIIKLLLETRKLCGTDRKEEEEDWECTTPFFLICKHKCSFCIFIQMMQMVIFYRFCWSTLMKKIILFHSSTRGKLLSEFFFFLPEALLPLQLLL